MVYRLKTIAVSESTYMKLKSLGGTGDSFNDVLIRLIETKGKKNEQFI
jgi:predicted CopG family antitoxin